MIEPSFRLLAITPPEGAINPAIVEAWACAAAFGVGIGVLLRRPGVPLRELLPMITGGHLRGLAERCHAENLPLLLSLGAADIDHLTQIGGAAGLREQAGVPIRGVQLRGDPKPAHIAALRRSLGPRPGSGSGSGSGSRGWIVGRSCHGAPQGQHGHVHYTCVAPIFPPTTPQAGVVKTAVGLGTLRSWSADPQARIFALGGVGPTTAEPCLSAGAWGLAGIGLFFGDPMRVGEDVASVVLHLGRQPRDVRPLPQR